MSMTNELLPALTWVFSPSSQVKDYLNPLLLRPKLSKENWEKGRCQPLIELPTGVDPASFIYNQLSIDPLLVVTDIGQVDFSGIHRYGFILYHSNPSPFLEFVRPSNPAGFLMRIDRLRWLTFIRKPEMMPFVRADVYGDLVHASGDGAIEDLLDDCMEAIEFNYGDISDVWMTNFDPASVIDFPRTVRRLRTWWEQYDGPGGSATTLNPVLQYMIELASRTYEIDLSDFGNIPSDIAGDLFSLPAVRIHGNSNADALEVVNWITLRRELIRSQEWLALRSHLDYEITDLEELFADHAASSTYVTACKAVFDEPRMIAQNI